MKWTDDQAKVIALRNRNLLVSAAAGSGKTAVLIERILSLVLDPEKPIDVDRLLIVTFTNAAAAQMRERLYLALQEKAEQQPENRHLRRQLQLVFQAQVCTIDSFCLYVLRNYPEKADIDPAFRIMDSGEEKLLQSDTIEKLFEEEYEEGRESFHRFLESFSSNKNDEAASELVLSAYRYSRSAPWPEKWLKECCVKCEISTPEQLYGSDWCGWYLEQARLQLQGFADEYHKIYALSVREDVPETFPAAYLADIDKLLNAMKYSSYHEAQRKIAGFSLEKQPSTRKKGYNEELQKKISNKRKALKERIDKFKSNFEKSEAQVFTEIAESADHVKELVRLVGRFSELYSLEKQKKCIADFPDIEHKALELLYHDGVRSEAAKELSERFVEIMIDEYQDSNRVQEQILTAVSRQESGQNNIFMVGDMKQSIYRFRMADPGLFTEKYASYTEDDSPCQKVELSMNFRSRKEVTRTANWFFFQLMQKTVGGIDYTRRTALDPGARYPAGGKDHRSELLLACTAGAPAEYSKQEIEAAAVAREIKRLTDPEHPFLLTEGAGTEKEHLRPAEYRDIVILFRAARGSDTAFQQILEEQGIPVYVESRSGYFDAPEVKLVLDLLSVIDNPMNDVPLAAVMHSRLFSFTAEELAVISASYPRRELGNGLYGALRAFSSDAQLAEKIGAFLEKIAQWRKLSTQLSLSMLLLRIYNDTGLLSYVLALPGGDRRHANLSALLTKAENYEKTSYHGIFHFIRYVEKLKKYQADEGEMNTVSEADNVVRIMTIHKSKGLEFPIVFLAGIEKGFNTEDSKKHVVLHQEYGIAADYADPEKRIRRRTMMRQVYTDKNLVEGLGEELRVLYVGMTRAKEKLYLCGAVESEDAVMEAYGEHFESPVRKLNYGELIGAKSFMEWIFAAFRTQHAPIDLRFVPGEELRGEIEAEEEKSRISLTALRELLEETQPDEASRLAYENHFRYRYDDCLTRVYSTISVSAVKAAHLAETDGPEARGIAAFQDKPIDEIGGTEIGGAERGTLYHSVMERCDPHLPAAPQLKAWLEAGTLTEAEYNAVDPALVDAFFRSPLGIRFTRAMDEGRGFRERQFIIGIPAAEIYPELSGRAEGKELLMLQGIIDLYFEEDDGFVIVDYKTDRVREAETLVSRYKIQLDLYARALTQVSGKKVKEKWIWSFALGKEIVV
ncbi:MAG: helicase-exonuclease AddAB subunit AddA [Lachnospiraceae bacterium]|nr:helicase-exonuclease AddAB subunit AddA [Lachnospiraceae bacterium]